MVLAFLIALLAYPGYVGYLRGRQIGQFIREEGPKSHGAKANTPTMGGVLFACVAAVVAAAFLYAARGIEPGALLCLAAALTCSFIGFLDDRAKFQAKANAGISASARLLAELAAGALLALLALACGEGARLFIPAPFAGGEPGSIMLSPFIYVPLGALVVAGSANAVNLHDGMDGLAAGTSIQVLAAMAIILAATGQWTLAAVAAAAAGAVSAFLIFNRYPASVFMGDVGSLFIGGLVGALALVGGITAWFVPLASIYILETLSVMAQVAYFKLTKQYSPPLPMPAWQIAWLKLTRRLPGEGKRLLRMAPLHHHFEAVGAEAGMPEWQVVACFWLAQLAICLAVLLVLPAG